MDKILRWIDGRRQFVPVKAVDLGDDSFALGMDAGILATGEDRVLWMVGADNVAVPIRCFSNNDEPRTYRLACNVTNVSGSSGSFVTWRGDWNSVTAYVENDLVSHLGSSYIAVVDNTNIEPGTDPNTWGLIAQKGDTGAQGIQGIQGEQGIQGPQGDPGPSLIPTSTAAAPGIPTQGDSDSGIYALAAGNVGISRNGTSIVEVQASGVGLGIQSIANYLEIMAPENIPGVRIRGIQVSAVAGTTGASAPDIFTLIGAQGQNASGTGTNNKGGLGGKILITAGAGGDETGLTGATIGGVGGSTEITGGKGGTTASTTNNTRGGIGGGFGFRGGDGGRATGASGNTFGGDGGAFDIQAGVGGNTDSATGTGGNGGAIYLAGGRSGQRTGGGGEGLFGNVFLGVEKQTGLAAGNVAIRKNTTPAEALDVEGNIVGSGSIIGASQGTSSQYSIRKLGTGATDAAAGNDSRLSDARTPTAHASTHAANGTDKLLAVVCTVYNNATKAINNSTLTIMDFDSELFDPYGMHDPVTNNSRITIVYAGVYSFHCTLEFEPNSTGIRQVKFIDNNGATVGIQSMLANTGGNYTRFAISAPPRSYAANAYVRIEVYQDSGAVSGSLNIPHNVVIAPTFSAIWHGAAA